MMTLRNLIICFVLSAVIQCSSGYVSIDSYDGSGDYGDDDNVAIGSRFDEDNIGIGHNEDDDHFNGIGYDGYDHYHPYHDDGHLDHFDDHHNNDDDHINGIGYDDDHYHPYHDDGHFDHFDDHHNNDGCDTHQNTVDHHENNIDGYHFNNEGNYDEERIENDIDDIFVRSSNDVKKRAVYIKGLPVISRKVAAVQPSVSRVKPVPSIKKRRVIPMRGSQPISRHNVAEQVADSTLKPRQYKRRLMRFRGRPPAFKKNIRKRRSMRKLMKKLK